MNAFLLWIDAEQKGQISAEEIASMLCGETVSEETQWGAEGGDD